MLGLATNIQSDFTPWWAVYFLYKYSLESSNVVACPQQMVFINLFFVDKIRKILFSAFSQITFIFYDAVSVCDKFLSLKEVLNEFPAPQHLPCVW